MDYDEVSKYVYYNTADTIETYIMFKEEVPMGFVADVNIYRIASYDDTTFSSALDGVYEYEYSDAYTTVKGNLLYDGEEFAFQIEDPTEGTKEYVFDGKLSVEEWKKQFEELQKERENLNNEN